jgi:hypothetical protein
VVVAFEGDEEVVVAGGEAGKGKITVLIRYGELGIGCIRFRGHADCGFAEYLFAGRVNDMSFDRPSDLSLGKGSVGHQKTDETKEDKQGDIISHI